MRSYITEVTGWQLYQVYALFEDAKITRQTLDLSQPHSSQTQYLSGRRL